MADCSELSKLLTQIAMNVATRPEIKNLDDVVHAMKVFFPDIRRSSLVEAMVESAQRESNQTDELQKKLRAIKAEAYTTKNLDDAIEEFDQYLETGELPEKKKRKKGTLPIEVLRKTRDNLRRWVESGDPAMRKKFSEELDSLTKQIESGEVEVNRRKGKLHTEIQKIKDEVDQLKQLLRDKGDEQSLIDKIDMLQSHLDAGTLPVSNRRAIQKAESTQRLRSIINELRKELNRSEPARRGRIQKSLNDLEKKLRSGEILPKPKPPLAQSEEIDKLLFQRNNVKKEIQDQIQSMRPLTFGERAGKYIDVARLMMTTGEFSFALRQGGVYAYSHPLMWSKAVVQAFRAFGSPRALHDINEEIFNRPFAYKYDKANLVLLHEGMSLTQSEEVIMNYWNDKLPIIRNFNRAAIAFFNTSRADMFDMGYKTLGRTSEMTDEEAEVWANYINVMTGRGKLKVGAMNLEGAALTLNRMFFSARYVSSRFQMIGGAIKHPILGFVGENKRAHRLITMEYARLGIGFATIFSLGMMVGADIEDDPRSPDFGKLKFGNRRLDVLMGHGQVLRFMAQMLTGATKRGSGDVVAIRDRFVFGDAKDRPYGGDDILQIMARFGRSKLSPQMGFAFNILTGETMIGEEVNVINTGAQFLYPITFGDVYEVMQEDGVPASMVLSALAFLGMGLQTYESRGKVQSRGF